MTLNVYTDNFVKTFREGIVDEQLRLAGVHGKLYVLDKTASSKKDPLYHDVRKDSGWVYGTGQDIIFHMEKPDILFEPREEGQIVTGDAVAKLSRSMLLEDGIPEPKQGDVIWSEHGFFDILKTSSLGYTSDNPDSYTVIECTIQKVNRHAANKRLGL